jgi:hypothetical protein
MKTNKPFGWEVLEQRYGGLRARLETMYDQIIAHVQYHITKSNRKEGQNMPEDDDEDDPHQSIPEFDADLKCLYYGLKTNMLLDHARVISPSRLG